MRCSFSDEYEQENLPLNSTPWSVASQFKAAGSVLYVSLPRAHRDVGRGPLKGFGFIEFESECEVNECVHLFDCSRIPGSQGRLRVMSKYVAEWMGRWRLRQVKVEIGD